MRTFNEYILESIDLDNIFLGLSDKESVLKKDIKKSIQSGDKVIIMNDEGTYSAYKINTLNKSLVIRELKKLSTSSKPTFTDHSI